MLVKISENFDFGQIFKKFRFWSKFTKIPILLKIYKNFDSSEIFKKKFEFVQNFR